MPSNGNFSVKIHEFINETKETARSRLTMYQKSVRATFLTGDTNENRRVCELAEG